MAWGVSDDSSDLLWYHFTPDLGLLQMSVICKMGPAIKYAEYVLYGNTVCCRILVDRYLVLLDSSAKVTIITTHNEETKPFYEALSAASRASFT
ncbi:MAG: hypothetical protein ACK2US_12760, partial [Anaerolineae bacterium]